MKELRTAAEVLERLSHNQDALRAAVEELAKWVGDRGAYPQKASFFLNEFFTIFSRSRPHNLGTSCDPYSSHPPV